MIPKNLVLFMIKDSRFAYQNYGLDSIYFSIDLSNSVQQSKGVATTQYALLDGTTRIDTVSREPGNITFQGKIGEVHYAKDKTTFVKSSEKARTALQLQLLEDLRDRAIILDVITEDKTYKDYLITNLNVGKNSLGMVDINFQMKEALMFGDEIDIENVANEIVKEEQIVQRALDTFRAKPFNTDLELINEVYRIVTESELTTLYMLRLGSFEAYPDIVIDDYEYKRAEYINQTTNIKFPDLITGRIYYGPRAVGGKSASEYITGITKDNMYLHISIDGIKEKNSLLSNPAYVEKKPDAWTGKCLPLKIKEEGIVGINIRLLEKTSSGDNVFNTRYSTDLMISPKYSNQVINGINPLVDSDNEEYDYIADNGSLKGYKAAFNFLRKCSQNTYRTLPNLLSDIKYGYLYQAFYEYSYNQKQEMIRYITPGFVYIHPEALPTIRRELERIIENSIYFRDKKIEWWS